MEQMEMVIEEGPLARCARQSASKAILDRLTDSQASLRLPNWKTEVRTSDGRYF